MKKYAKAKDVINNRNVTSGLKAKLEIARPLIEDFNSRNLNSIQIARKLNKNPATIRNWCKWLHIKLNNKLRGGVKINTTGWIMEIAYHRSQGLTQNQIAEKLGVSKGMLSKWLKAKL
jgi:DNA-binding CsgD family transcriptional regulator